MNEGEVKIRLIDGNPFATMTDMTRKIGFHCIAMNQVCKMLEGKIHSFQQRSENMENKSNRLLAVNYHLRAHDLEVIYDQANVIAVLDSKQFENMSRNQRRGLPNRHDRRRSDQLQQ